MEATIVIREGWCSCGARITGLLCFRPQHPYSHVNQCDALQLRDLTHRNPARLVGRTVELAAERSADHARAVQDSQRVLVMIAPGSLPCRNDGRVDTE